MNRIIVIIALVWVTGCTSNGKLKPELPTLGNIEAFKSSEQFSAYLDLVEKYDQIQQDNPPKVRKSRHYGRYKAPVPGSYVGGSDELEEVVVAGIRSSNESITNNQEKGVDQGDIVKRLGDYLIVLRKDMLYSLHIGDDQRTQMRLISKTSIQSNGENHDSWYDELLVYDNLLLVIGYSYELDASEMVFFKIAADGSIEFHQRYLINTDDYYDSENSATRIVDGKLIMVLPTWIEMESLRDSLASGLAKSLQVDLFRAYSNTPERIEIAAEQSWIKTVQQLESYESPVSQVYSCDLNKIEFEQLSCQVVNLLGVSGKFYVSPNAIYIWDEGSPRALDFNQISPETYANLSKRGALIERNNENQIRVIYRIGVNRFDVSAVAVHGAPLNQFSFQEINDRFTAISLNTVDEEGRYYYDVFGINFPLSLFSTASSEIKADQYTPISSHENWPTANRFAHGKAFVSSSDYMSDQASSTVDIWDIATGTVDSFTSNFDIQAFHPLENSVLALGTDGNDSLVLETWSTAVVTPKSLQIRKFDQYSPTESRSVGFNATKFDDTFIFAIPIVEHSDEEARKQYYRGEQEPPTDIVYFESGSSGSMTEVGKLLGSRQQFHEDECKVSCDDWYGVARPFFINGQVFGLIDFELLRGNYSQQGIKTTQRLNIQSGELRFH